MAYLGQHHEVYWAYSVSVLLGLGAYPLKLTRGEVNKRIDEALDLFDLRGFAKQSYLRLSGGERQRVQLARLWVQLGHQTGLWLLDEPFNHIDQMRRHHFCELLRARVDSGSSVILVSHDWDKLSAFSDKCLTLQIA
jgi:iron complex transport system ATP-binding protein